MDYRLLAIFLILCVAFGEAGCASKYERGDAVVFPMQTGSRIQRRGILERSEPRKPKKPRTKKKVTPPRETSERKTPARAESEFLAPSPTPPEMTPTPPEKFR